MICPKCKKEFSEQPALSRADNSLKICTECATTEALENAGLPPHEQKAILNAIMSLIEKFTPKKDGE